MSVGLVAIAAGLRNLLGFSFHVLGSEFSIDMSTLNLLFVYHLLLVGFFPAVKLEYLICFVFLLQFSDWLVFQKQQKHQSVIFVFM